MNAHLNRMRSVYRAKHDLLIRCLREMSDILELYGENAGLHVRVRFKNGMTEEEALRRAAGEKIRVYGLGEYVIEQDASVDRHTVLLGYGPLKSEEIQAACRKLEKSLEVIFILKRNCRTKSNVMRQFLFFCIKFLSGLCVGSIRNVRIIPLTGSVFKFVCEVTEIFFQLSLGRVIFRIEAEGRQLLHRYRPAPAQSFLNSFPYCIFLLPFWNLGAETI